MKRNYERPLVLCETFVMNRAIAQVCEAKDVTMQCLAGPDTDNTHVIVVGTDACIVKAATTELNKAEGPSRSYTNTSGGGLLYVCIGDGRNSNPIDPVKYSTGAWVQTGETLKHSGNHNNNTTTIKSGNAMRWHCQVAPISNAPTVGIAS